MTISTVIVLVFLFLAAVGFVTVVGDILKFIVNVIKKRQVEKFDITSTFDYRYAEPSAPMFYYDEVYTETSQTSQKSKYHRAPFGSYERSL